MTELDQPAGRYMTAPMLSVAASTPLGEVDRLLKFHHISSLGVTDADKLAGVISRTDLLRVARRKAASSGTTALLELTNQAAGEVMSRDVLTIDADTPIPEAAKIMVEHEFHRLFVTDGDHPVGVLSSRDVMRAISDCRIGGTIEDEMSTPIFTVEATDTVASATHRLERAGISGVVVVEDNWPVGVFTQEDALAARRIAAGVPVEDAMNPAFVCMPKTTTVYRAAAQAQALRVRRIIAVHQRDMVGVLTTLDFARVAARG